MVVDGGVIISYNGNVPILTNIIIPTELSNQTITSIGEGAFYQSQLISVTLPSSIVSIGKYAFSGNPHLTSITLSFGALYGFTNSWRDGNGNDVQTILNKFEFTDFKTSYIRISELYELKDADVTVGSGPPLL